LGWARSAGVFGAAIALRIVHLFAFRQLPFHDHPFGDSLSFVREAEILRHAGLFAKEAPYFQGPLYPLLLAGAMGLGLEPQALYILQVFTGALTALLVAHLATRLHSPRAGLVAGGLYAAYDVAIALDGDLLATSLVTTAAAGAILALTPSTGTPAGAPLGRRRLALGGALLGGASWGHPNLALPAMLLAVVGLGRRASRRSFAAYAGALLFVLAVPVARNLVAHGSASFATSGGVNFFIGNHAGATGTFRIPPESGLSNDLDLERISRQVASRESKRDLSPTETSRYWFARGARALVDRPGDGVALWLKKVLLVLNRRDLPNHLDLDLLRTRSFVLRWTPVRSWVLIALGIAGLWLFRREPTARRPLLFLAGSVASLIPFFVTDRYRLPMMPVIAAFAGTFVASGPAALRGATLALAAALVVTWLPVAPAAPRSVALVNLGASYAEAGNIDAARTSFAEALRTDPRDARALENLAVLEFRAGRYAEALAPIEHALALEPRAFAAWSLRGATLGKLGRFDEAVESLERALEIHPQWEDARVTLAAVWRDYLSHCQEIAEAAGVPPPRPGEDPARFVEFLESQGLKRAAERVRRAP